MTLSLSALPAGLWRASELARYTRPGHRTGFASLDHELPGGGWPQGAVTELLCERAGIGEWRLLAPALRDLTQAGQAVLLVAPPLLPYAPALAAWGIDLRQLTIVTPPVPAPAVRAGRRTARPRGENRDMLWAAEQALKGVCCGAVLAWLPAATPEQVRRLQVAASGGDTLAWLIRPAMAAATASASPLRLGLTVGAGSRLAVRFHKRRGPPRTEPLWLSLPAPHARAVQAAEPAASHNAGAPCAGSSHTGAGHGLLDRLAPAAAGARDRTAANA
ncbi:damage-inducible protein [Pandoraea terrae]|uniref:Damage-inducible protein n=1 Tax=Pandoraea terrae TaxID=1537710 RepID=A0A5E4XEN3_9BURK|nr:translesion DNA synthesis-associated protein ImuA [Pandoraea terrae]VVE34605.1 damage-inducible protein [Pandoraea terrae]